MSNCRQKVGFRASIRNIFDSLGRRSRSLSRSHAQSSTQRSVGSNHASACEVAGCNMATLTLDRAYIDSTATHNNYNNNARNGCRNSMDGSDINDTASYTKMVDGGGNMEPSVAPLNTAHGKDNGSMSSVIHDQSQCNDANDLPNGWERVDDPICGALYVNHNKRITQFEHPNLTVSTSSKTTLRERQFCPAFTRNPDYFVKSMITTQLEKSLTGFGFTIVGGSTEVAPQFLQIKQILPNSPADHAKVIEKGDILVLVNNLCVLGFSHAAILQFFRAVPVGDSVCLTVAKGYLLDSNLDNASTELVSGVNTTSNNKAVPVSAISMQQLHVELTKSESGFGFTVADSPRGQFVNKILRSLHTIDLRPGDFILEVNGIETTYLPHDEVIALLMDVPVGGRLNMKVQRADVCPAVNAEVLTSHGDAFHSLQRIPIDHRRPMTLQSPAPSVPSFLPMRPDFGRSGRPNRLPTGAFNQRPLPPMTRRQYRFGRKIGHIFPLIVCNGPTGFDFKVVGGSDTRTQARVESVIPGGSAERCGLAPRDYIFAINGVDTLGVTHAVTVGLICQAARCGQMELCVFRGRDRSGCGSAASSSPASPCCSVRSLATLPHGESRASLHHTDRRSARMEDITIYRTTGENFGFVLRNATPLPTADDSQHPPTHGTTPRGRGGRMLATPAGGVVHEREFHIVGDIVPGGAAYRSARLDVGDRVVSVNGRDTADMSHDEVVAEVARSDTELDLTVIHATSGYNIRYNDIDANNVGVSNRCAVGPNDGRVVDADATYVGDDAPQVAADDTCVIADNKYVGADAGAGGTYVGPNATYVDGDARERVGDVKATGDSWQRQRVVAVPMSSGSSAVVPKMPPVIAVRSIQQPRPSQSESNGESPAAPVAAKTKTATNHIELSNTDRCGFGILVCQTVHQTVRSLRVAHILPHTPAARCADIGAGDEIVRVNGAPSAQLSYGHILEALSATRHTLHLDVVSKRDRINEACEIKSFEEVDTYTSGSINGNELLGCKRHSSQDFSLYKLPSIM